MLVGDTGADEITQKPSIEWKTKKERDRSQGTSPSKRLSERGCMKEA